MDKKLIPIIGVVIVLVGIGAYYFFTKNGSGLPSVVENKIVEQEVMKNCKFETEFCKYMANMASAYKNGVIMNTESTIEGSVSTSKIMQDGKGNMETISYENGVEVGHIIYFDKYSYIKSQTENIWTEYPPSEKNSGKTGFDYSTMQESLDKVAENADNDYVVKRVGTEKCGKLNCIVYTMTMKDMGKTKVWIDDSQFLSRRTEYADNSSKSIMTFDYTPVKISKPSPVKAMPNVSDMINSSGNVDMEKVEEMMKDLPKSESVEE